jgi:predicted HicB family RNase H-like nuclease
MKKTIDRYTYREEWSEDDNLYVARCLEFPSLSTHGDSPEKALAEIRKVVAVVLHDLQASKEVVPEPLGIRQYSGKLVLRLPRQVHRDVAIRAAEEGVSLNQYLVSRLA